MPAIVVIGEEPGCAGFRLTGIDARSPVRAELEAEFARALASAAMVVLSRDCAAALPSRALRLAMAREMPLVVVMPDIADPRPDNALVHRMRAVLGIEA